MILIDSDLFDHQLQIVPLQLVLIQNVLKHLYRQLSRPVHPEDGVALVGKHVDLMADALDLLLELHLQFIIGLLNQRLLFGALHDLPDALALGDFQLFQKVIQYCIQPVGGDFHLSPS